MLFNSYIFILVFLPITIFVFFQLSRFNYEKLPIVWLVFASLFYYGWWNPIYLLLIISSMLANYFLGNFLLDGINGNGTEKKYLLYLGVTLNLVLLGYFKYANFFIDTINIVSNTSLYINKIILPLGISFFTFEQIAYLVDSYRGDSKIYSIWHYSAFVTFFPQLIAGPIAHHKEIIPQLNTKSIYKFSYNNFSIGLTIFIIGLFKKVMIADKLAIIATPVFNSAEAGHILTFFESWIGILAYTFQIYFDFSGYSDMAVGLGKLFGITLPFNFNSPYKAKSIIGFWRRWHITLSRFLRDYLYIPLGGNRNGHFSRYKNLMVTMLLGGLWHGAGWTFVVWGLLHGFYLAINNLWRYLKNIIGFKSSPNKLKNILSTSITFLAVIIAWVFFRAESFQGAKIILKGMLGNNGIVFPHHYEAKFGELAQFINLIGINFGNVNHAMTPSLILGLFSLLIVVQIFPNSQEIILKFNNYQNRYFNWRPNLFWLSFTLMLTIICLLNLSRVSEFLYYQF